MEQEIFIRKFRPEDRSEVRRISCQTAFLGMPIKDFIDDEEIIADALTRYYTDYEPESCFVAVAGDRIAGYLTGSKNLNAAKKINNKIVGDLFLKIFNKGLFVRVNTWRFVSRVVLSFFRGEFNAPNFSNAYPAVLHINIDRDFRGQGIGSKLIARYMLYLEENAVTGVHFGTISEKAKIFFLKNGFHVLLERDRSYLSAYSGYPVKYYIFGKRIKIYA